MRTVGENRASELRLEEFSLEQAKLVKRKSAMLLNANEQDTSATELKKGSENQILFYIKIIILLMQIANWLEIMILIYLLSYKNARTALKNLMTYMRISFIIIYKCIEMRSNYAAVSTTATNSN